MDPLLLYKIIEYIDSYSLITLFNIDPYQTNIQDLIDIQYNTQYINKHIEWSFRAGDIDIFSRESSYN